MARPERNTIDYFPHMLGEGKKMFFIEHKYGNNGYATWYKILEKLGSTEFHYLNLNREDEVMFLAAKCKVSEELLLSIINDLSKMDVFDKELWNEKIIWCPQFIESIEDAYKKRNNKCITLSSLRVLLTSLGILKPIKLPSKGSVNPQRIVKDSKVKDSKEENSKYIIPEFTEFLNYALEKKPKVSQTDLKLKYDSWVANDWKNGYDKKITNWKTALLNTLPYIKEGLNSELSIIEREEFMRNAGKM
jgi:hypothetical protein